MFTIAQACCFIFVKKTSPGGYKGLQEYNLSLNNFDLCGTLNYESSKQLQINIFLLAQSRSQPQFYTH